MNKITQKELNKILKKHIMWLNNKKGGERANLSGADLSGADLSGLNLSKANLAGANLAEATLAGANLSEADLYKSNLSEANLAGANLAEATLAGSNLSEANLSEASLVGANLARTNILTFQFNQHFAYSFNGLIRIGCLEHEIEKWLKEYRKIGKENKYTESEIELYGDFIKLCAKLNK